MSKAPGGASLGERVAYMRWEGKSFRLIARHFRLPSAGEAERLFEEYEESRRGGYTQPPTQSM